MRWGIIYRGSVIISGNEAWNRNVLNAGGRLSETGQISLVRPAVPEHYYGQELS